MTFNRLLHRVLLNSRKATSQRRRIVFNTTSVFGSDHFGSRSAFTSSKPDVANPNWLRVGLAFGSSAFLWGLLFKQHSTDVHEYRVRNGLE